MEPMIVVITGCFGFLMILLCDFLQISAENRTVRSLSSIGYSAVIASIVFLVLGEPPSAIPAVRATVTWVLMICFASGLVYSVLLEIPIALKRTRRDPHRRRIVASGTYGLVRHPGFVWFVLLIATILFRNPSGSIIAQGAILVASDLLLVVVEDRMIFPRVFADYEEYRRRVPFIIPRVTRREGASWR
jgi:protein-S-isoprenylcysteine O-methyltransferase Ste14